MNQENWNLHQKARRAAVLLELLLIVLELPESTSWQTTAKEFGKLMQEADKSLRDEKSEEIQGIPVDSTKH